MPETLSDPAHPYVNEYAYEYVYGRDFSLFDYL